jgi:hypothetical protein
LSEIDPIPTIPSYLSKIHFNIVHPPTSWSLANLYTLKFTITHTKSSQCIFSSRCLETGISIVLCFCCCRLSTVCTLHSRLDNLVRSVNCGCPSPAQSFLVPIPTRFIAVLAI